MSAQQFPRPGVPPGLGQALISGGNTTVIPGNHPSTAGTEESSSDADHGPRDHPSSTGGPAPFRDDKQETVVVRPYPQVQVHGQPLTLPQHLSIQPGAPVTVSAPPTHLPQGLPLAFTEGTMKGALKTAMPSRLIAPAPASDPGLLAAQPKVPGQVAVTMDAGMPPTSAIPVATISSQQGHASNLHHLMAANVQIIRSSAPALQITSSAAPPHTFTSHLPRGAAAAAVMSSTKGPTVLRPASGPGAGGQPVVQHILQQPIQSRPAVTTSTAVPTVVAPISATRPQSPVITTGVTHSAEVAHGRPGPTIHPQSGAISIQRPPPSRDTATRITLPSHPAIGVQKTQPPHTMAQKPIFSTVTPVAAATVAPIQATNMATSTAATGSSPHTQMTTSNIVTMTMPPHSSHASGVNTSTIPVAKVVPQPITHASQRIHADYPGERGNLIPISAHRSSPNPVTMEARSDSRQSVPMQFQYILPTYPSSPYPLTHTYTPITSSVSGIRQYPVTPQAPSPAIPAQAGVGVASAVHLNPMQLMTVDRIGLQSAQLGAQAMQPAAMGAPGIQQPAPVGAPGLHTGAPIGVQQAPVGSQQPPQPEPKASVVLADGAALVANPLGGGAFAGTQAITSAAQSLAQSSGTATPAPVSSPRPSILRKKPANEGSAVRKSLIPPQPSEVAGCRTDSASRSTSGSPRPAGVKSTADIHMAVAPPATCPVEAPPSQASEVLGTPPPAQHLTQASPALLPMAAPPSQPAASLSSVPAMAAAPPVPASLANVVAQPAPPVAIGAAASIISSIQPEPKVKQEAEPMDTSQPAPSVTRCATPALAPLGGPLGGGGDAILGASPRKKPRKQQHVISTEESEMVEAHSTDEERSCARPLGGGYDKRKTPPKEYIDEEGVRYVPVRPRPPITLLRHYRNPWKAAYHHFQRYSDIRVKEGKKGTLQDVASQKAVACRAQGYKIRLCAAQMLQLMSLEHDVYSRLTSLQEGLIPKKRAGADDDLHRINELIQGNMQRCKLVMDQVTEAREAMMKVLDHKDRVMRLLGENGTKKSSKLKHKERA
ncbi:histone deacetylase complex subunit SAP130a isoform X1 [Anguilla anguilla]|uniref:histone deacetylase complex subunit SAP130a isoform X1 n=1 Tax=Anguilla anguilla TaxID=7936 RepID=UPI0015B12DEF|nr:histone deacetylase complex subunit SAP130a isoform X1 [Anguilla anguilla]